MKTETKKKFVVMAVDRNDCSDETPKKLAEFDTREEAVEYIHEDMRGYCDNYTFVDKETGKTVGPKLYVACGIGDIKIEQITKGIVPCLIAELIVLLLVTYIPGLSTMLVG